MSNDANQSSADGKVPPVAIDPPCFDAASTVYDKVVLASERILNVFNITKSENAKDGGWIYGKAIESFSEMHGVARSTFLVYLSAAVKDPDSSINCLGKKQGYYLTDLVKEVKEIIAPTIATALEAVAQQRKQREACLYPVLESWLVTQGYQSSNVSSNRSLGKWGNPDVAGISVTTGFNGPLVEVVTVEAKVSLDNWEQWIFEAVSHRRFANRSYFAFAHPEEAIAKIPQDMRYYAELYNIGVLAIAVEEGIFNNLTSGSVLSDLDVERVDVIEIFSAPYNFVQPRYQIKFCNALGVGTLDKLYRWGLGDGG